MTEEHTQTLVAGIRVKKFYLAYSHHSAIQYPLGTGFVEGINSSSNLLPRMPGKMWYLILLCWLVEIDKTLDKVSIDTIINGKTIQ
jgi:hypothetical protein